MGQGIALKNPSEFFRKLSGKLYFKNHLSRGQDGKARGLGRENIVLRGNGLEVFIKGDADRSHRVDEGLPVVVHDHRRTQEICPGVNEKFSCQGGILMKEKAVVAVSHSLIFLPAQRDFFLADIGTIFMLAFKGNDRIRVIINADSVFPAYLDSVNFLLVSGSVKVIKIQAADVIAAGGTDMAVTLHHCC